LNNLYNTKEEIYSQIDELTQNLCKDILSKHYIVNGKNKMSYYIINKRNANINKRKSLMIFGEHSRELISPEMGLYIIKVLCKQDDTYDDETVEAMLFNVEFIIVPIVNEFGRDLVEKGSYCWRTNENGVDINRNWDSHWEYSNVHDVQFPGDKPFSEWETRAILKLMNKFNPEIFISTHAGTLGMYTPYAYKKFNFSDLEAADRKKISTMLKIVKNINTKYCDCKAGSIGNELWYLCPGTCLDYAYEHEKIRYTFAFEIYDGFTTNPYYLKIMNDPDLKAFNYKKFIKENTKLISKDSPKFLQFGTNYLKVGVEEKYEKMNYHIENNHYESCFSQMKLKDSSDEECNKQMNPLTLRHFNNTLINWMNVYLELFSLIINE
jgi:hypothetical protein